MKSESIYTPYRSIRKVEEGQTARQCEEVSQQPLLTLLEQEQQERRIHHEAMVAEKQRELAALVQEYEVSFAVLQDSLALESAKQAALILCDEIRKEQKQVQVELDALLVSTNQSDLEASLTIPQDIYEDKGSKKAPFYFEGGE